MGFFGAANKGVSRPVRWVAIYMCVLLLLFFIGVIENRADSEGMGFFPLLVLTTPWSWLLMGMWDSPVWGSSLLGRHFAIFFTCNLISAALNGFILYFLVNHLQKRGPGTPGDSGPKAAAS